jgi:Uma2 family endonuclease
MEALREVAISPEEYHAAERDADFKSEYIRGEVITMSGAALNHNRICANLAGEIREQLKDQPCEVVASDMKVQVEKADCFFYPDLSGLCDGFDLSDDREDIYTNPQFIIEVLSDSTESYDRGKKFFNYQTLESLREYVLVSQKSKAVETFRKEEDHWLYRLHQGDEAVLKLDSVNCEIPLREIYRNVTFPD